MATHDYGELDRAIAAGDTTGFAELVGDRRGRLVRATVAAPAAAEAIAELTAWLTAGRRIADVSEAVHAYPTFAEGPARAADDYLMAKLRSGRTQALTRPLPALARVAARVRA